MTTAIAARPLREVTQSIPYSPGNEQAGIYGNCLQAALASALDMELEAVPNLAAFASWEAAARLWLRGIGADWRMVPLPVPRERSIIVGQSPRSTGLHAVVGERGGVTWDPHPDRTGLTSVRCSYVLEQWPADGVPSSCVICGSAPDLDRTEHHGQGLKPLSPLSGLSGFDQS